MLDARDLFPKKKDKHRKKGKGRHCCLGDNIYSIESIPCRASCFALG